MSLVEIDALEVVPKMWIALWGSDLSFLDFFRLNRLTIFSSDLSFKEIHSLL